MGRSRWGERRGDGDGGREGGFKMWRTAMITIENGRERRGDSDEKGSGEKGGKREREGEQ